MNKIFLLSVVFLALCCGCEPARDQPGPNVESKSIKEAPQTPTGNNSPYDPR